MKFVEIDHKRWKLGMVLAVTALLLAGVWGEWKEGVIIGLLFFAAGSLKLRTQGPGAALALHLVWMLGCMMLSWLYPVWMLEYTLPYGGPDRIWLNLLCAGVCFGAALIIFGRIRPAVVVSSTVLLLFALVNCFVVQFRSLDIQASDLLSIGTALNVAGNYQFTLSARMVECFLLWALSMFAVTALPKEPSCGRLWPRLAAAAAAAVCLLLFGWLGKDVPVYAWGDEGSMRNGLLLNVFVGIRDSHVDKPENYETTLAELEQSYPAQEPELPETLPDIIIIMDESLADMKVLGEMLPTNQPVTPFLDSLTENTIRGTALASIFGGGTATSEFEVLTGFSMAFLPTGSIAYQQYLHRDTFSLAHVLKSYGYDTLATHPFVSNGWNRTTAYPLLGFDEMTFLEDYPQQDLIREYVSDREMFDYVLARQAQQGETPLFLFGITMQNHGGYEKPYQGDISLPGYPMAEQYLSLLHETDAAVEHLFTELEKSPRDTIVLLFGDHYPKIEESFYEAVHGGSFDTLSDQLLKYTVPYYIWANFDISAETRELTSLNYLPVALLQAAGMPLPPVFRLLEDARQVVPAVCAYGFADASGQLMPPGSAQGEEAEWLHRYSTAQYSALFDKKGASPILFP